MRANLHSSLSTGWLGLCVAGVLTAGGAERSSRATHGADVEQSRNAVLGVGEFESPAVHQVRVSPLAGGALQGDAGTFFWIAARPLALNKPGVGVDGNHAATHAGARSRPLGRAGTACVRRSSFFFARRVAGHLSNASGSAVGTARGGVWRAGAVFRGGRGIQSHTAQANRRAEGESRASAAGNEGMSCPRHLTRARLVRRIPNSPFSLPLALDAAATGRGARTFFVGVA